MEYEWHAAHNMPSKRVFSTAVAVEDKLYVLGGCDIKGTPLGTMEKYDPETNKWTKMADMPTKRAGTCALHVENKIIALGGIDVAQQPLESVEVYDTTLEKWSKGDSLPEKLLGLSGVVRGNKIIIVGGMGLDTNPKDHFLQYDVSLEEWTNLPLLPTPRYATFSFLIDEKLYVLGGRQGKKPVKAFEVFDFDSNKWTKLPDIPTTRVFAVYVHSNNKIYSLGGLMPDPKDGFSDVTEIFDIEKGEWHTSNPMLCKRGDFAAGCVGGKVVVAGGLGNHGVPLKTAEVYDDSTDTWRSLPELPSAHCSCAFTIFQNRLHIIGGLSVGGPTGSVAVLQKN